MRIDESRVLAQYERKVFFSKDGYEISVYSNHWRLNKDHAFNFDIQDSVGGDLLRSFRQVLAFYGETCSAGHTTGVYNRFKKYFELSQGVEMFSPESLISYRDRLGKKDEYQLSSIRAFMRTWLSLGYPGIPSKTMAMLEKWRIKGNEKGYAVQSMCPESGPFTDIEMDGIVSGVLDCYASGALKLRDTCYAMILAMTGRRPTQVVSLKLKDLIFVDGKYSINFPRAKQKYAEWRSAFKKFEIVEDLWVLLQLQANRVKASFEGLTGTALPSVVVGELPLFHSLHNYDALEDLRSQLDGDFLHARTLEVNETMRVVKNVVGLISERTGAVTHLNAYRFRYTLGTNLAREGRSEYIIAEALDHSDIQNTGVYVKNIPDIVERIDKAVALQLAPIAQAFQGVIVRDETKARRGEDRSSRVCSAGGKVGTCGSYGFCGALAPIACYTCSHFQPWLDGPHELVLDELLSERDSVLDTTRDLKITSVNDRLILAVSNVVARCNAMKSELADV
ncbi:site-specific integrase [Pseudomonas sp. Y24-6]|uniref:site-specific integrase n=1 Tax=Pseudomonas sp. Y24-6 TaxID=2750013 RepID=UPI001CE1D8DD|nr:site-specific integrase [Pseudomonas sp. Y24-6]MCA4963153.1 tyrosine-type recombinase/integrase [Pseudomonas sp. Y24-6]